MRGLVRLLVMFGPMIFRQIQKFQRNKQRQQPQLPRQQNGPRSNRPQQRHQDTEHVQYKDLNKELGRDGRGRAMSAEERDFNLKEEDIMLSEDELKGYKANSAKVDQLNSQDISDATKKKLKDLDGEYDEFFEN